MSVSDYKTSFPNAKLQCDSIKLKGEENPFYGKKHSKSTKERLRKRFLGTKISVETKKKIAKKIKDPNGLHARKMSSDEYRKKISNSISNYWNSDVSNEHRELNSKLFRERRILYLDTIETIQQSEQYSEKMSNSLKAYWHSLSDKEKNARIQKQLESYKMSSVSLTSKGETKLYEMLSKKYEVERWKWIFTNIDEQVVRWNIDMYVHNLNVYVQFDGVYWHGLDRPIDVIRSSKSSRDKTIYKKWQSDRQQDVWFQNQNKKLIRITDIDFKNDPEKCLEEIYKIK